MNSGRECEASDRIKWSIDRTRLEMDHTLDELGRRLKPRRLMDDLVESVLGSSGESTSGTTSDEGVQGALLRYGGQTARSLGRHPLPAALIGAGVAWWIMESRRSTGEVTMEQDELDIESSSYPYEADLYYTGSRESAQESSMGRRMMRKAKSAASRAGEKISSAGETVKESAGDAASSAQDAASRASSAIAQTASGAAQRVSEASSRIADGARSLAQQAGRNVASVGPALSRSVGSAGRRMTRGIDYGRRQVSSSMHEYPLAAGLAVCGVGIGLGLLLPRTRREDEMMGQTADQLKQKAMSTGQQIVSHGREVATAGVSAAAQEIERKTASP